jgi:hypothetical protein
LAFSVWRGAVGAWSVALIARLWYEAYGRTANAKRQTPNAERRTPNAERRTPNAER